MNRFSVSSVLRWLIVAPLSVGLGWLFERWNVPAAWILAAIVTSGAMALTTGQDLHVNRQFYRFGRGIIGVLAAMPLVGIPPRELGAVLVPAMIFGILTTVAGIGGGVLLARSEKAISTETAMLSMLPGGSSTMPALASEIGADYRYVSLVQYLRLLIVSVTLPLVAHLLTPPAGDTADSGSGLTASWLSALVVAVIAIVGEPIGKKLHIPAPAIVASMALTVAAAAVTPENFSLEPPKVFAVAGFLVIGWMAGGSLSMPTMKRFARQLPITVAYVFFMMAVCAGAGFLAARWMGITFYEGYLATTPGALETVLALSAEGGAGSEVIAFQVLRLIAVLLLAAWLPQLLRLVRGRGR